MESFKCSMGKLYKTVNLSATENNPVMCAARHAVFWLVAGNSVGLLLSVLLLFPSIGQLMGEWTYGRWIPLHLNWQLYGWTALPLISFTYFLLKPVSQSHSKAYRIGIWAWSTVMALGGIAWLNGHTGGKIFLDWTGGLRVLFPCVIIYIWITLFLAWWKSSKRSLIAIPGLLGLLCVPFALYVASSPEIYPPVDPSTGGPTGASLLNSTLGVALLFLILPSALRKKCLSPRLELILRFLFVAHILLGIFAESLPPDHHTFGQILCLSSLIVWPIILPYYYKKQEWIHPKSRWQYAMFVWFAILTINGLVSFLPGILDHIKFTNALVAHSHLAMAGFTTAFLIFLLQHIVPPKKAASFDGALPFWSWHITTATYICLMILAGILEAGDASFIIYPSLLHHIIFILRSLCGVVLLSVSIHWWKKLQLS